MRHSRYDGSRTGTALECLNPARFQSDVVKFNAAADAVMAAAVKNDGAKIATVDLYSFVVEKCGGDAAYKSCPGTRGQLIC